MVSRICLCILLTASSKLMGIYLKNPLCVDLQRNVLLRGQLLPLRMEMPQKDDKGEAERDYKVGEKIGWAME